MTTPTKPKRLTRAQKNALIDEIWAEREALYKKTGDQNKASLHRRSELFSLVPRWVRYKPAYFGVKF